MEVKYADGHKIMISRDHVYGFLSPHDPEHPTFPASLAQILDIAKSVRDVDGRYIFYDHGGMCTYCLRFSGQEITVERYDRGSKWFRIKSPENYRVWIAVEKDTTLGKEPWKLVFIVVALDEGWVLSSVPLIAMC